MASMAPGLKLKVDNKLADDGTQLSVDLKFGSMDDFDQCRSPSRFLPSRRSWRPARSCAIS